MATATMPCRDPAGMYVTGRPILSSFSSSGSCGAPLCNCGELTLTVMNRRPGEVGLSFCNGMSLSPQLSIRRQENRCSRLRRALRRLSSSASTLTPVADRNRLILPRQFTTCTSVTLTSKSSLDGAANFFFRRIAPVPLNDDLIVTGRRRRYVFSDSVRTEQYRVNNPVPCDVLAPPLMTDLLLEASSMSGPGRRENFLEAQSGSQDRLHADRAHRLWAGYAQPGTGHGHTRSTRISTLIELQLGQFCDAVLLFSARRNLRSSRSTRRRILDESVRRTASNEVAARYILRLTFCSNSRGDGPANARPPPTQIGLRDRTGPCPPRTFLTPGLGAAATGVGTILLPLRCRHCVRARPIAP